MSARCSLLMYLLALGMAAAGVAAAPGIASAQGRNSADLRVSLELTSTIPPANIRVAVSNNGDRAAYDVVVEMEAIRPYEEGVPENTEGIGVAGVNVGYIEVIDAEAVNHSGVDPEGISFPYGRKVVWYIPVIEAHTEVTDGFTGTTRGGLNEYRVTVRSADPVETGFQAKDNSAVIYVSKSVAGIRESLADHGVTAAVGALSEDTFDLEVTVVRGPNKDFQGPGLTYVYDACVDIILPPGMAVVNRGVGATYTKENQGRTYDEPIPEVRYYHDEKCRTDSAHDVSGAFRAGNLLHDAFQVGMTLPVAITDATAGEPQCVRAELTALPTVGVGLHRDDPHDNVAEACLGATEPVRELFESGDVEIFTVFDCFARQTDPCDGTDGVRVRAVNKNVDPETIMAPGTTTVQVRDPVARVYDSYLRSSTQQSVTDGNTVSWQTATEAHVNFTGTRKGVKIFFSRIPFNGQLDNWVKVAGEHVTVRGLDGGNPPGDMYIRTFSGSAITKMDSSNDWTATYDGTSTKSDQSNPSKWFAELEKLGTYVVDYTTIGNRDNTNGDCQAKYLPTGVTAAYCDTETYTFHVGPVAELGVRDGGSSPEVSSDQRVFTVEAFNNGPDPSLGAEVMVRLPANVSVAEARPSAGSYDVARNAWILDELPANRPQTLTLITDAEAGTEISASIAIDDAAPYTVCIGSDGANLDHDNQDACEADTTNGGDWHEGTVFDYLDSNNTATIRARSGLAGGVRGAAPTQVHAIATGPGAYLVYWKEPESGSERDELGPVRSWDIDYNDGDGWKPLLRDYLEYSGHRYYANHNVPEGSMRQYRVRARYDERASEWTEQTEPGTAQATAASGDPGVTIRPTALTLREGSSRSYRVSLDARPAGDVAIDVSHTNPDVRLTPTGRLVFTPSNWSRAKTVSVYADRDSDAADDTDTITHVIDQAATSADYDYFILPDVTVSVTDTDTAVRFTVGRSGVTVLGVDEGGSTEYQLALGSRPTGDVRVSLSFPSGIIHVEVVDQVSERGEGPRNLVFTPENYNQPRTIKVTGVQDDDAVDDDLGFICHNFSGGYAESTCLGVVVTDDDRGGIVGGEVELALSRSYCPGIWPEQLTGAEIAVRDYPEESGGCFYSLRLNKAPTGNVTVRVTATNPSKVELDTTISHYLGEETPGRLVFTPENWRDAQEIRFAAVRDPDGVDNNDFTIRHTASGGGFNNVVIPDIKVTVIDHDRKYIGFRVEGPHGGVQVTEGGSCTWNENLYDAAFYMFPETQPTSTVTVAMRSDNSDVRLSPSRLSFTRSNWDRGAEEGNPGKRVMVCASQDSDQDDDTANITFTVTSSDKDYNGRELTPVPVRVVDDDKEQGQ